MIDHFWGIFLQLVQTPFQHEELVWGIVPLYFGWIVNELSSPKPSYLTATQAGFGFLWAGAHWTWQYFRTHPGGPPRPTLSALVAVNVLVTGLVLALGLVTLVSGLRRKYPRHCSFLGHTRFSAYFMIAIFPIQSNYLQWSWDRVAAILLFAVPIWLLFQFGLMPMRR